MTQPDPAVEDNLADRLAPLQDLTVTDDTDEPGRFRVRAVVPFPEDGPQPEIVVHLYSEATDLSPEQIAALRDRAEGIQAGFALVLSAGLPQEPEPGGDPIDPPDPHDPDQLVIEPEVTNPTGDDFVARLIAVTELYAQFAQRRLDPGKPDTYVYPKPRSVTMRVYIGVAVVSAEGDGHARVATGQPRASVFGRRVTVRAEVKGTEYNLY